MNCDEWFEKLYRYIDRDLDQIVWKDVEAHMHDCRPCYSRYELEVKIKQRLKESCESDCCTEALRVKIRAILEKF